jgi:hypothetical protein
LECGRNEILLLKVTCIIEYSSVDGMTRDGVLVKSITHIDGTDPTLVNIQERWAQDVCYATQGMFA